MSIGIFLVLCFWNPLIAKSPTIPTGNELLLIEGNSVMTPTSPIESVKFATLSDKLGEKDPVGINNLSAEIYRVIQCESGWDNSKIGKAGEVGLAQFMPATWKMFNEIRGTNLDIYNEKDQIEMIGWAFENGYQNHWTCWKLDKSY